MDIALLFKRWVYLIVIIPCLCNGQMVEDFSDGDFILNPAWYGDINLFKVNDDHQLQLSDNAEGVACLFTPITLSGEYEWRCWVRQAFSPSGNNNSRIYLLANEASCSNMPDGVFLQLGEPGSFDAIRLMRQVNGDTNTLIRGTSGNIALSFYCRIKILYTGGSWQLLVDYSGGEDFLPEGNYTGYNLSDSGYLGVICKYTISNSTKFYFDDFYCGPIQYDTIPPDALRIAVSTPLSLEIHFSENLDIATAENSENYSLDFGYGNPVMAVLNDDDASIVEIVYADTLIYGERMILGIQNVSDLSGNALIYSSLDFAYYKAERYDVIINEIMADPSPPQSLPEYEYLELYNTTDLPLDLSGWTLIIGSAEKELRGLQIVPYGYLIIGKDEATNEFLPFGDYYGLESFSLLNSGQSIVLTNKEQEIIHSLRYDERWYGDDEKSDGGWSLEQINPYNPCMMADNWGASGNIRGGSPGNVNSLLDELYIVPSIKNVCAQDSVRIRLEFNQAIHNSIVLHPEYFSIDHNAGEPQAILPEDPYFSSFTIYPSEPLYKSIIYELSCYAEISNCIGDVEYLSEEVSFGVPEKPSPEDIIINEILFNPFPGGVDYIELYNRSQKPINLKGFSLASVSNHAIAYSDTLIHSLDVSCNVLLPGEYVLLCKDFYKVDDYYSCPEENTVIEMTGFPSYGNESGCVILFDDAQNILDAFCYHEDMHYPLFNFVEGVSLERIHYDRPSSDATNWHSASQMSGFGTPGYQNSQFSLISDISSKISISPKVFTPGVDGVRDNISIQYKLDTPGCLATMLIFNSSGQLVRHLVNNELLGTEGSYSWDGIKDDRQKALAGMYIIFIELIDLNGKVDRYKETLVIAP